MRSIAICDDSAEDRFVLCMALKRLFLERNEDVRIAEYSTPEPLVADLEEGYAQFDLVFLAAGSDSAGRSNTDGSNPDSMRAARRVRHLDRTVPIMLLADSPDYAVESYEIEVQAYLLKPLEEAKLRLFVNRLFVQTLRPRIALRCGGAMRYFFYDEILWIESEKHNAILHISDGREVRTSEKLGDIEEMLQDQRFLRCHQSYIVNMDYVVDVTNNFILEDGSHILIRVRSRKAISDTYYSYFARQEKIQA